MMQQSVVASTAVSQELLIPNVAEE